MKQELFSVITPVFNAERFLERTLGEIAEWRAKLREPVEIIFVNDGSTDRTLSLLAAFAGRDSSVQVIQFAENHGKGFALREGMRRSHGEYVAFTDADLPYGLNALQEMRRIMQEDPTLAFLYGSRSHVASRSEAYGSLRTTGRRFFSVLIRLLAVPGVADTQCGVKMLRRRLVDAVVKKTIVDRFAFDVELFVIANAGRMRSHDFPVELREQKQSSIRLVKDTINMFGDLFRIRVRMWRGTPAQILETMWEEKKKTGTIEPHSAKK